jgi:hypothetical protein
MISNFFLFPESWNNYLQTSSSKYNIYSDITSSFKNNQIYIGIVNIEDLNELKTNEKYKKTIINYTKLIQSLKEELESMKKKPYIVEIPIENYYINNKFIFIVYNNFIEDQKIIKTGIIYILSKYIKYSKLILNNFKEIINNFFYSFLYLYCNSEYFRKKIKIIIPETRINKLNKYKILEYRI